MAKLVLELDIEPSLIDRITGAAQANQVSLNEYTEKLFRKDVEMPIASSEVTPFIIDENLPQWIKDLVVAKSPTPDFDAKQMYGDHIMKKYGV